MSLLRSGTTLENLTSPDRSTKKPQLVLPNITETSPQSSYSSPGYIEEDSPIGAISTQNLDPKSLATFNHGSDQSLSNDLLALTTVVTLPKPAGCCLLRWDRRNLFCPQSIQ